MRRVGLQKSRHHRGVVMAVVLFILAALSVMMLVVSKSGREQVGRADLLMERMNARLEVKTRESELLLSLLTQPWIRGESSDELLSAPYVKGWRFDGVGFQVSRATIRLQDVAGLFVMPQPGINSPLPMFRRLLLELGVEEGRAEATVDFLQALQSPPKELPLQDFSQLLGPGRLTMDELERLRGVATLYPVTTFNPASAPVEVLSILYDGSRLQGLLSLRENDDLTAPNFEKVMGDYDAESMRFSPGPTFLLVIEAGGLVARYGAEGVVTVDPYAPEPIKWWSRRGLVRGIKAPPEP